MHLARRGTVWRFQIRVPRDLEPVLGPTPIRIPIGTATTREAQSQARLLAGRAESAFLALKARGGEMSEDDETRDELIGMLKATLEEVRKSHAEDRKQWMDLAAEERRFHAEQLRAVEERYKQERASDAHVLRSATEKVAELAEGGEAGGADAGGLLEQLAALLKEAKVVKSGGKAPRLGECIEDYVAAKRRRGIDAKFARSIRNRLADFIAFAGDKPLDDYAFSDLQGFADMLANLPTNWMKKDLFKDLSLKEAAEKHRQLLEEGRHPLPCFGRKTIKDNYVGIVRTAFGELCVKHDCRNPFERGRIFVPAEATVSVKREAFSVEELNRWFAIAAAEGRPDDRWLPLLGTLTGARLAELIYLQGRDIYELKKGLWVADLTKKLLLPDGREKRRAIKTETSIRIFALHAVFEEVGFLDYARKKKEGQWLFPALHSGVADPPSTASKRVNYRLKKAGIHRARELVFHSSRHTSKDLMRIAHVDPRTIDRQTGHAPTSVGDRYGSKHLREDEIAVLAAIPLPEGLDLGPYLRRRKEELEGRRK